MASVLCAGQISDSATPNTAAAEIYYLASNGYGMPTGEDTPLLMETVDVAPASAAGAFLLKRIEVPVRYSAACQIRVTAIVDFVREVASLTESFASPSQETQDVVVLPVSQRSTAARVRVEVLTRQGRVTIGEPTGLARALTAAAPAVIEAT